MYNWKGVLKDLKNNPDVSVELNNRAKDNAKKLEEMVKTFERIRGKNYKKSGKLELKQEIYGPFKNVLMKFWLPFIVVLFPLLLGGKPVKKTNFVLIVADDLGFADLSIRGSSQILTPNIDEIAEGGIMFTNGYVSAPVCSPSRAGLMTGWDQVRFGHDNNLGGNQPGFDPEYLGLPVSEQTMADRLKALGYVTGIVGKWHLGDKPQFHSLKRGFDEFWGYTGGGHDYFTAEPGGRGYKVPIECSYKTPGPITYISDNKGDECVEFIQRHKDGPFFLYAAFNAPHAPLQATEVDLERFKDIQDKKRRTYCAMVYRLDLNVGKILSALKENGLEENTMIVFLSDNGGPVDSNASINAPLNGQKGILLDGGIRVPYFIKWPGNLSAGKIVDTPVLSLDILRTFVEIAGGEITSEDDLDGVNLLPYLKAETTEVPHKLVNWRFTISAAVRDGDWKLIRLPDHLPMQNIDRTKTMLKELGDWDVRLPHPVFMEGAVRKPHQLQLYDRNYPFVGKNSE